MPNKPSGAESMAARSLSVSLYLLLARYERTPRTLVGEIVTTRSGKIKHISPPVLERNRPTLAELPPQPYYLD